MKRQLYQILAIFLLLPIVNQGEAFEEIGKVQTALQPMDKPELVVGQKWHYFSNDKGKDGYEELLTVGDGMLTFRDSDGCQWQEISDHDFSPSVQWENCEPYPNGTQKTKLKGSIWPLQKGTKFSYSVKGKYHNGDTWSTRRACKVKKEVRISTVSGEYDTFKVVCRDDWSTRTYYMSPELKSWVVFKRTHAEKSKRRELEVAKIE